MRPSQLVCSVGIAIDLLISSSSALAVDPAGLSQPLVDRFRGFFPNSRVGSVRPTPIHGLFEIEAGANVFYSSMDGKYLFFGHLYDVAHSRDLTADAKRGLDGAAMPNNSGAGENAQARFPLDLLPISDANISRSGNGSRKLVIFTDPLCSYCQVLQRALLMLTDVTVASYVVSILTPHNASDQRLLSHALTCPTLPDEVQCRDRIARNTVLFQKHSLPGTPTLIRMDGVIRAGALATAELDGWLNQPHAAANSGN